MFLEQKTSKDPAVAEKLNKALDVFPKWQTLPWLTRLSSSVRLLLNEKIILHAAACTRPSFSCTAHAVFPLLILISRSQPERLNTFPPCLAAPTIIKASMQHFIHGAWSNQSCALLSHFRAHAASERCYLVCVDTIFRWCKLSCALMDYAAPRKSISWCGKCRALGNCVHRRGKNKSAGSVLGLRRRNNICSPSHPGIHAFAPQRTWVSINKTNSSLYVCKHEVDERPGYVKHHTRKVQVNFLCTFVPAPSAPSWRKRNSTQHMGTTTYSVRL